MTRQEATATAKVLSTFLSSIEALESCLASCKANDVILAWDNGLGVNFSRGKGYACGVIHADAIPTHKAAPVVKNGHGEVANPVSRRIAVEQEIARIEGLLADINIAA